MLIPAICLPPLALPLVGDAEAEADPVAVAAPVTMGVPPEPSAWPRVGSGGFPFTSQPFAEELGQAGGVTFAVDAE